jgi:hypothetical protein
MVKVAESVLWGTVAFSSRWHHLRMHKNDRWRKYRTATQTKAGINFINVCRLDLSSQQQQQLATKHQQLSLKGSLLKVSHQGQPRATSEANESSLTVSTQPILGTHDTTKSMTMSHCQPAEYHSQNGRLCSVHLHKLTPCSQHWALRRKQRPPLP